MYLRTNSMRLPLLGAIYLFITMYDSHKTREREILRLSCYLRYSLEGHPSEWIRYSAKYTWQFVLTMVSANQQPSRANCQLQDSLGKCMCYGPWFTSRLHYSNLVSCGTWARTMKLGVCGLWGLAEENIHDGDVILPYLDMFLIM